jgi:hypothetical protein
VTCVPPDLLRQDVGPGETKTLFMSRALIILAAILTIVSGAISGAARRQDPGVTLHITVVLPDANGKPIPVPGHALLISDNPATSEPRRVVTTLEGTADVRLRPGNYTVESDTPLVFNGKLYDWTQIVDIAASHDAALALTADNADITAAPPGTPSPAPPGTDESLLVAAWRPSVVGLWTPTAHASGFVIDADGLVATSQRSIGAETTIEVQVSPAIKVAGRVLVADTARDVAVLRIDPGVLASVRPVPLACTPAQEPHVVSGQTIVAIDAPLDRPRGLASATVGRVAAHDIESDLYLSPGSLGGPVFTADGLVGIASVAGDAEADGRGGDVRIVRLDDVCEVVAASRQKLRSVAAPGDAHLPVEPEQRFPVAALKEAVQHRAGSLDPYHTTSASFDIFFMTPVLTYGAEYQAAQQNGRARGAGARPTIAESTSARALTDFGNWSEYVAAFPPVLLVRMTPKLVEGFWTKFARHAAETQGVVIPPIKRFTSGFSRMQAYCGNAEVTPIHPFRIERRVSEADTIEEGLYVFDPGALAPSCGSVRLVVYPAKEPEKGETLIVDPKVIQRIWEDFAPYRAQQ